MTEQVVKPKVKRSLFRKIINSFIGIFLVLILLIVVLLGFTQTKTFRNWLREKIITLANDELNGKLNIEKIDGTILTSIYLRNTSITIDNDTLVYAKNIEIKTSPLQLLLKKIYFRKIRLEDVRIKFLQNQNGEWNYAHLVKPTEEDTTESSFPFSIQANDLRLGNIDFVRQTFSNLNSAKYYQTVNFDDLKISNLNLAAQLFADIDNSDYLLKLEKFSFKPNVDRFTLRNISGEFALTKRFVNIMDLAFITDSSDVRINVRLDSLNIFGNTNLEDLKNCPVTLDLDAASFNFDDLSSFIGSTEILKGDPSLELKAHGKFGRINIDKAILDYKDTHFEFAGKLRNLNVPSKLFIRAQIKDTDINYKDVNVLLPSLKLPEFALLSVSKVNVDYEGEPTNFKAKFSGDIEDGSLKFDLAMNMKNKPMEYDIKFETGNLDLMPVIGMTTSFNSAGSLSGKGISPAELNAQFDLDITSSTFNQVPIDELTIRSKANNRKIDLDIEGTSKNSNALITGVMEFDKDTIPSYSLIGSIKALDLSSFMNDHNYKSNLNFYFSAEGTNIDPDKISGMFSFGIDSSRYQNTAIPYSNVDIVLKSDSISRSINLISDFVDFNINGNFSVKKAAELLAYESKAISNAISKKLDELNPLSIVDQSQKVDSVSLIIPGIVNDDLEFDYDFKFKNFDLITALIGNNRLDIVGSGSGSVKNKAPNFSFNTNLDIDYMIFMQKDLTVYLSDVGMDFNFTKDNRYNSFDNLFGTVSLTGKRFYSSANVKNITADVTFNESKLVYNVSADIEDNIKADLEGTVLMTPIKQQILVNKLNLLYNGLYWTNDGDIKILFDPAKFNIAECSIKNGVTTVNAQGTIESNGNLDIQLAANYVTGRMLTKYISGIDSPDLKAKGELKTTFKGTFSDPIIHADCKLDNLSYKQVNLGSLTGDLNYSDKKILLGFYFLDSTYNKTAPLLSMTGTIPIDLSFTEVKNRFPENQSIDIKLLSNNFTLKAIGNLLPAISNPSGDLTADIKFTGTMKDPRYEGFLVLQNGKFTFTKNNLDYTCGLKMKFENRNFVVDSMVVANNGKTKFPGQMTGTGSVVIEGFSVKDLNFRMNGDLAVLSPQSRSVSPLLYGELLIGTEGDWQLTKRGTKYFFNGDILLKQTDLTYTVVQDQSVKSNNFNITYVVDSTKIDKELIRFQEVLSSENNDPSAAQNIAETPLNFDYEIGVSVENSARLIFILSQAANQKLIVEMDGDLKYESYGGDTRAQGAFNLKEGSKLEFFKTFDATGSIRFESDITNPYLDITATYTAEYIDPRIENAAPEDVAVKIKIKGPLSDLGKNLSTNQQSIGVYVSTRNIQNDIRDTRYDYADALSFILFGKFKDDLTAQDKSQLAGQNIFQSTATSFLGSVLSSYINSAVGDLINDIQISNTGESTKFNLSGRIQNLRYSFGGTTEVFQNLGKANFKLEYGSSFLIRLEARDPIGRTYDISEKIYEMALKYRFEF